MAQDSPFIAAMIMIVSTLKYLLILLYVSRKNKK